MLLKELEAGAGMLAPEQIQTLRALTAELSPIQAAWLSGYLAAVANQGQDSTAAPALATASATQTTLTILYGSQTGNGRKVAEQLAELGRAEGRVINLQSMNDYKPKQLAKEQQLLLVVSTHGEGDPPDDAIGFHKFLLGKRAPKLDGVNYSVLALGDSSYEQFCQTGRELDERLTELGATRVAERVDCDVDFQDAASLWQQAVLAALPQPSSNDGVAATAEIVPIGANNVATFNRDNPYAAELIVSQKITGRQSSKDIRHVEIDLADSDISYHPGDALGIWLDNDPQLVEQILEQLQLTADDSLRQQLLTEFELTLLHPGLVKGWAELSVCDELTALIADSKALRQFVTNNQLIDVVTRFPAQVTAAQLTKLLRKLTPRLYSIASAQSEVENEVHLTVAEVAAEHDGQTRLGAISGALARRLESGDELRVYIEPNNHFRLPENDATPVIMIGPGTGIAPFRSFMQERDSRNASGDNWLFFGNPTFTDDFLYQVEWQNYVKSGLLTRIDLAFSRDQAHKIYVQDRLREQAKELYVWLERGAHLYVCGDATRMAKDVETALLAIIEEQGQLDSEQASDYLEQLRQSKRYQKDVY
ncbi:assimilatory sulfite reductase (NADPH) flavoprotein subunit [Ferrimonas lipolytica]|uniref:Sulfite reductase [NADPH] flavoprotein alpha-component n=1 Tax=Ferrimonas lipolytica TaxID=2724191 RepID=A0A6H1UI06_9GAMM|nr:assimilatory sulfite reductase (NADPH) flavoprotein subunit [Ferrimonas lipolytica]QIZ78737.1 assimilatory sulfite reductase (NADPH) flavoprotein subunit [Ferrimonas lipolytica]